VPGSKSISKLFFGFGSGKILRNLSDLDSQHCLQLINLNKNHIPYNGEKRLAIHTHIGKIRKIMGSKNSENKTKHCM
jgi:hypothetical protein